MESEIANLEFDCVNNACLRKGFCARADWRRGGQMRHAKSDFGGGANGKPCPWFVPTRCYRLASPGTQEAMRLLRGINDLRDGLGDDLEKRS